MSKRGRAHARRRRERQVSAAVIRKLRGDMTAREYLRQWQKQMAFAKVYGVDKGTAKS